jgi:hypothetical protein
LDVKKSPDVVEVHIESGLIQLLTKATIIPDWSGRDLKLGTLRAAIKQLGIEWSNLEEL